MRRLNSTLLEQLPADVSTPNYDREHTGIGIVHLGVGAFHRGHQAWFTEQVLRQQGGDWAIAGASLRSATVRDQLEPQDGLYSLVVRDGDSVDIQVVGAIKQVLVAGENPQALIERMASEAVKVITLTITEKGYCHNPATGELDKNNAGIQRDLAQAGDAPETAIGNLVAALARRRENGAGAVTILSCDNLPHNGRLLQLVVDAYARVVEPALAQWIADHVAFPCSMVDRIVPAPTEGDYRGLEQRLGVVDSGAVFTEPFCQWVIEHNFAGPVPDWESAGALYVDDVAPFEDMKLRLLNGSHSLIAYLGYVAGYDHVHEVMADADFNRLVRRFMEDELAPTLSMPADFDLEGYMESLVQRFANRALNHKTRQIAQDGSQKIPQRWLRPAQHRLAAGKPVPLLALAVAGWIRYLQGRRDSGDSYTIDDPLADRLADLVRDAGADPEAVVRAVMAEAAVFGDLAERHPEFVGQVVAEYRQIIEQGMRKRAREQALS